ncbi:hypothetical protein OS42_41250 [Dickeya oryzae]
METLSPVVLQGIACDWLLQMDAQRYQLVEQRVVGQLLQTLLYEEVLPYHCTDMGEGNCQFVITGRDAQQQPVEYRCNGLLSDSFALIRLDYASVQRVDASGNAQSPNLHLMLEELLGEQENNPFLTRFVQELEQTQLKDLQSRAQDYRLSKPAHQLSFDELERHFMDAHSYHPCYKSRIGFSLQDNAQWGPEFGQPFAIVWLALSKQRASANQSTRLNLDDFLIAEFGETRWQAFSEQLARQGRKAQDYQLIPVHPWQWKNVIAPVFYPELVSGELIYLGDSDDRWQAQQSIRTLANVTEKNTAVRQAGDEYDQHLQHPYSGTAYGDERAYHHRLVTTADRDRPDCPQPEVCDPRRSRRGEL